jgi:hypothetical protein
MAKMTRKMLAGYLQQQKQLTTVKCNKKPEAKQRVKERFTKQLL